MGSKPSRRWWHRRTHELDDLPWLTRPASGPLVFDPSLRTAAELVAMKRSAEVAAASAPRAA
jgi:hypothetical protein